MSGGGKGGSTTTSSVQIPPEVLARYNAVNAQAQDVAQQPFQKYSDNPNAFVAPLTSTQQAGIANTNAMAGAAQPYYANATNQLMQAQQGAQPFMSDATAAAQAGGQAVNPGALDINQYMNPYTQSVVNATQAAMNQQQGQQLSQQQGDAIRSGAFGGERAGLQRATLQGQQSLAQAQAISPLYQQNYNQALAAAQQQQGVGLGAAQANRLATQQMGQQLAALGQQSYNMGANTSQNLASLGTNAQQAGLAGAQAQMAAGQAQQQTEQAGKQALYNQFQQGQAYPFQVAQFLANIAEGTGALSGNTTTSTTTGGGGFFSDKRLKENVQKVGKTNDGQPIYRFNYKGDPRTQIGLMAQDVEKSHPEAVGLAGGYKTVDYKKATQGAVRKADGGAATDNAYSMDAPSALLQDSGKGLGAMQSMELPHMVSTDDEIRNNAATFASRFGSPGADAASIAAMRSPSVAGQISGPSRAGYQAELDTLLNASNNTNLGAGPAYVQSRANTIRGILGQNTDPYSSQGGLVGSPGAFARGGFAGGGYSDPMGMYHNAALEYYGPQGSQNAGLGAIIAQGGGGARSLVPAQAAYRPPQKDAIAEANQMAGLVTNGAKAWDARPNFMRSASDVAARNQTEMAQKAVELQKIQWAKDHGYDLDGSSNSTPPTNPDPSAPPTNSAPSTSASPHAELDVDQEAFVPDEFARRGGLINHRNHYRGDGFVPYGGGLGGGFLSGILQDQAQEPTRQLMDSKTKPTAPKPQSSPVGEAMQIASFGKMGKGAYDWAGKQLAGEASPTGVAGATGDAAAGLGGAEAGGGALAGDVGGGTGAILGDVGADVAGGAAADAAAGLGADVAVDAAAPEMMAGLAGSEGVADFLPFLFLKNGGAAQNRRHFETDANVPVVNGDDTDQTTIVGKGNKLPKVPVPDNRPGPEDALVSSAPTRSPKGGVAPSSSFSMPDFSGLVPEGAKDTLTSENFWVPALAGIGSMLASPNKTLLGAVGSGLVGGTTAYTNFSQQNANQLSKRIEMAKNVFSGPYEKNGVRYWRMAGRAEPISEAEYPDLWNKFVNGEDTDTQPKSVAKSTTDLAKTVSPAKVTPPTSPTGTQSAPSPAATAPATAAPATAPGTTERATPPAPATPAPATTQAPAAGQLEPVLAKDPNELKDQILSDNARWKDKPLFRNAPMLLQKAQEETDNANRLTTRAAEVGAGDTVNAKADENALLAEAKRSSENAKMYHEASQKLVDDAAAPTISRLNANDAENVKYFNDQATTDQARQQSRMQVNAIRDILENFEPGTFAEQKAHFAGVLRSLGVPPEKIQSATVNAPAFQEFTKDMMRGVFSDVAKIGGQLRVAELAGLEKASANPSLQPEANQKILSQALGVLNAEDQRFRDEQDARKKFGWNFDRSDFQNKWHEQNKDIGKFVSEAGKNIAVRGATPADWSKLQPGQAYIVEPTNDPNKRGVKVPTKLRYLGADPQTGNHRWAPISGG